MLLIATFLFNCIAISSWRSVAVGYTIFLSHGKGLSYGGISMKLDVKATGQRIKKIRTKQNITQEKLAEMANITPHYVYEIESGLKTMSIHILASISQSLKVSSDYLLFGDYILNGESSSNHDALEYMTSRLNTRQRKQVTEILSVMIPCLKDE